MSPKKAPTCLAKATRHQFIQRRTALLCHSASNLILDARLVFQRTRCDTAVKPLVYLVSIMALQQREIWLNTNSNFKRPYLGKRKKLSEIRWSQNSRPLLLLLLIPSSVTLSFSFNEKAFFEVFQSVP